MVASKAGMLGLLASLALSPERARPPALPVKSDSRAGLSSDMGVPAPSTPAGKLAPERGAAQVREAEAPDPDAEGSEDLAQWRAALRSGVAREVVEAKTGLSRAQERRLAIAIEREARRNGLSPLLVVALIRVESEFDIFALSEKGAMGLMQLTAGTGLWLAARRAQALRSARHLYEFERNVELGCAYLAELLRSFGALERALLAYNMGPSAAGRVLAGPASGRQAALAGYPRRVLSEYVRLSGSGALARGGGSRPFSTR